MQMYANRIYLTIIIYIIVLSVGDGIRMGLAFFPPPFISIIVGALKWMGFEVEGMDNSRVVARQRSIARLTALWDEYGQPHPHLSGGTRPIRFTSPHPD